MNNTFATYLVVAAVSIALSGCASEERQYEDARRLDNISLYNRFLERYPESRYAHDVESRINNISRYRQISEDPARYLSVTFRPVDNSGKVATTSVVESTFRKEGVMPAAFMAYLLAEEGRVDIVRVKVAPVIESRAEVPLKVNFDATLHYEQNVYNSMYQYTPGGGHSKSTQKMTQNVDVLVNPGEKIVGKPIDFGELKLLEAGQTWVAYLEIKRKIKSIDAEKITVRSPSSGGSLAQEYGTPTEAKDMLEKAVAALKVDQAKALQMFTKGEGGFREKDLLPYCGGPDGNFTAHPTMLGKRLMGIMDLSTPPKPFGQAVYAAAQPGKVSEVSFMWPPRPGGTEPVQKVAYVTKVGDQVCVVSYIKQ